MNRDQRTYWRNVHRNLRLVPNKATEASELLDRVGKREVRAIPQVKAYCDCYIKEVRTKRGKMVTLPSGERAFQIEVLGSIASASLCNKYNVNREVANEMLSMVWCWKRG